MQEFIPKEFMKIYNWSINKICFVMFNVPEKFIRSKNTGNRGMDLQRALSYFWLNKDKYNYNVNEFGERLIIWDKTIGDSTIQNINGITRFVIRTSPENIKEIKSYAKNNKSTVSAVMSKAIRLLLEQDKKSL